MSPYAHPDNTMADADVSAFLAMNRRAWLHGVVQAGLKHLPTSSEVQAALHGPPAPPSEGANDGAFATLEPSTPLGASTVSIWLSAGPVDAEGKSCDMDNHENCRLYKVTWNLATRTGKAALVMDLTALSMGLVQPAVDRSGRRLAAVVSMGWDKNTGSPDATGLMAWIPDADYLLVDFQRQGAKRPENPTWASASWLLWGSNAQGNHDDGWWGNLHQSSISKHGHTEWVLAGGADNTSVSKGGAPCVATNAWPHEDCVSWRDPDAFMSPPGLPAGLAVTVFGRHGTPTTQPDSESKPIVASFGGWTAQISEFKLGLGRDRQPIKSCHHPAWNVSGTEILCTRQFDPDKESLGHTHTAHTLEVRALYGYRFDGSRWSGAREVVESTDVRATFPMQFKDLMDGDLLTYKYGHWCGSDRFVVATVFGQEYEGRPVVTSRILLFDTATTPPGMWDLTDLVEDFEGARRGTWRGIFSSCANADA